MIRILIVAAYASVRAGLYALLAGAEDCAIVGDVDGSAELRRRLPELQPDVVLFDQNDADGDRVLQSASDHQVALVMLGEMADGYRALANHTFPGWGYLLKDADGAEIGGAIRAASAGLVVLDSSLAPRLRLGAAGVEEMAASTLPGEALTPREREVLQWMAQGLPNKVIAARLKISLHTVKFHVGAILAKLGASSRTEAVTLGARRGFLSL